MNFPLFIAQRIYRHQGDRRRVSRPAIRIATLGVAIGLAVMLISVSVVLGFKHTIRDKVVGFGSHINVGNFMSIQGGENYPIQMDDSMMTVLRKTAGVSHVQRYAMTQGILKTDSDFLGVQLKGIAEEYDTTFIHQNMVEGHIPAFSGEASKQQIVISRIIADQLGLHAGDKVFAYFINDDDVRVRRYTVAGIYQTNLTMFDRNTVLTDLYSVVRLNSWDPDQATGAELQVADFDRVDDVENELVSRVNRTIDHYGETYSSATIRHLYPQIFSWLDLLDLNVWIILALMICVAGFTTVSGLLIIILERTNMIGLLKALGARNGAVRRTFLWFAVFIIGRGMLIGDVIGIGFILLQKQFSLVKLDASVYYVSTVPVEVNIPMFLLINVVILLASVFVLIAPSFIVSRIHPARSMRYE